MFSSVGVLARIWIGIHIINGVIGVALAVAVAARATRATRATRSTAGIARNHLTKPRNLTIVSVRGGLLTR